MKKLVAFNLISAVWSENKSSVAIVLSILEISKDNWHLVLKRITV